ncbi:response regulator [Actinokineospora inagensis]|uniref:response regulator n=1 Tax=Actinokineospora inagensis TaxID=103730 RepID=UPI000407336B|nr:response regulator transcription factor [Actinokineospora inagensis]
MIRVLIADDQALIRTGFREIVNSADDLTVIAEAANGADAVELATADPPDVVVMDIRMPELDGIEATRRITATLPEVRVLVLTTFDLDEYVFAALRAGASGFLLKDTPSTDLLAAIRVVAAGDALLSPSVTRKLIAAYTSPPRTDRLTAITPREREVLTLIAAGLSNSEIAQRLHITPGTTKAHVAHIMLKLSARDRVHLVILAYQAGLATA